MTSALPPAIDPLGVQPRLPIQPGSPTNPGQMTANGVKVVGFTVAALALVGLSRVWPTGAAFIAVAILLGVALTHSTDISTLVTRLTGALGTKSGG